MKAVTRTLGYFRLRWLSAALFAGFAVSLARAETPPAPANLSAHSGGDKEVALSWAASPGATSYTIFRSNTQNDTGIKQVADNITGTSYTAANLRNDLTYYFRVKAVGPAGTSGFSGEAAATTLITKQALPNGVYTFAPRNAPQLRLQAAGREAVLAPKSTAPAQQWRLTSVSLTTYTIAPVNDQAHPLTIGGSSRWTLITGPKGFGLTPADAAGMALAASGNSVTQTSPDGSAAQTWIVLPLPEGGPDGMPDPGTKFVPAGYQLVFSDEFNGDQIDLTKWETLAPYSQPHLNDEIECYSPEAVILKDGGCILRAEEAKTTCGEKYPWRSGAITSRATFRHAYYEARIKMPQGVGMWPAFWATSSKRWPPEWDFLEIQNTVGTLYQYMHPTKGAKLTWIGGAIGRDSVYTTGKGMPNPYDGYVIYGAEVTPRGITMWINGRMSAQWAVSADTIDPMWVNCELAVGGKWAGAPDATTPRQNDMLIDYVRVYQSPAVEAEVQAILAAQPAPGVK